MSNESRSSRPFLTFLAIWFIVACAAGASGRVAALEAPIPQMIVGLSALTLILFGAFHRGLRDWLATVNLRPFVAFHLTRFVGIAFLVLHARGQLATEFAVTAGWGDIVAAVGAGAIALLMRDPLSRPGLLFLWNAYGLADILSVVATAARIGMQSPADISALLQFPMSLVPTFVVPIIIATHVLVFWRLRHAGRAGR